MSGTGAAAGGLSGYCTPIADNCRACIGPPGEQCACVCHHETVSAPVTAPASGTGTPGQAAHAAACWHEGIDDADEVAALWQGLDDSELGYWADVSQAAVAEFIDERAAVTAAAAAQGAPMAAVHAAELLREARDSLSSLLDRCDGHNVLTDDEDNEFRHLVGALTFQLKREQPAPELAAVLADRHELSALNARQGDEIGRLQELLHEVGVLAANAPEDDAFSVCEEITMRVAAADLPPALTAAEAARLAVAEEWQPRVDAIREQRNALTDRIRNLASELEHSAAATMPSKKSTIELATARKLRELAGKPPTESIRADRHYL